MGLLPPFLQSRLRYRNQPDPFSSFDDEQLSPEEEARRELEAERGTDIVGVQLPVGPVRQAEPEYGPIRRAWEYGTAPIKALAGLSGTSLVHLLGIKAMFPEAYKEAAAELEAAPRIGPEVTRPLQALPALGDVAAQLVPKETRESTAGKILGPVLRLGGNILGDPLTYLGGLGAYTRAGRAAGALGEVQRTIEALNAAGKTTEAEALSARIPELAGRLAEAVGLEAKTPTLLERVASVTKPGAAGEAVAKGNVGRLGLSLPFSPAVGVAYAPEILESTAGQAQRAYEEARAGRYAEAAGSGAGALLTAGLGLLVGRGVIHEARASQVLERAIAEQLGEKPRPETLNVPDLVPREEGVPPGAPAGPTPEAPQEVTPPAGAVSPETQPAPAPVISTEPPALTPIEPIPGSERIKVARTPETLQTVTDIINRKGEAGEHLTKRDLIDAGLVSQKQADNYPMEKLLDALGATQLRSRLGEITHLGYKLRPLTEAPTSAGPAAPAVPPIPAEPTAVPAAAPVPIEAPAPTPVPSTPPVPTPRELLDRTGLGETITRLYGEGKSYRDIAEHLKDQEPLVRQVADVYNAQRKGKGKGWHGVPDKESPAPLIERMAQMLIHQQGLSRGKGPSAQLLPVLDTTPPELRGGGVPEHATAAQVAEMRARQTSTPEELAIALGGLREPTGIGEPTRRLAPQLPAITTTEELNAARTELQQIRELGAARPDLSERLADRELELQDAIEGAYARNVEAPPMPELSRPQIRPELKPEPPGPFEGTIGPGEPAGRPIIPKKLVPVEAPLTETRASITAEHMAPGPAGTRAGTGEELAAAMGARAKTPGVPGALPEPGREGRFKAAIARHIAAEKLDPAVFERRSQELLGVHPNDATPDQLSLLFTLADKYPKGFGSPGPVLDTAITTQAAQRLFGNLEHLKNLPQEGRQLGETAGGFRYEPGSPAGNAQAMARSNEARYGIPAEQWLQDKVVEWLQNLSRDDARFLRRGAASAEAAVEKGLRDADALEAAGKMEDAAALRQATAEKIQRITKSAQASYDNARNLRRLLLSGDEASSRVELTKLLKRDLSDAKKDYFRPERPGRMGGEGVRQRPIDDLVNRASTEGFNAEETARAEPASYEIDIPPRPEGMSPTAWRAQVLADPELRRRVAESLAAIQQAEKVSGRGRAGDPNMAALKQLASDLGVVINPKHSANQSVLTVAKVIRTAPSAASESLTNQLVAERGPQWTKAIEEGHPIGSGDAKVVDFEHDAGSMIRPLADAVGKELPDVLARVAQHFSNVLGYPVKFGGMTPSPQLGGVHIPGAPDHAYINPLYGWVKAETELKGSGLEGRLLQDAQIYQTSRNIVDDLMHEFTHNKAKHDAATGDVKFFEAYANATRELGPSYGEMIREVRDALEPIAPKLGALAPEYRAAIERMRVNARELGALKGAGAGPGEIRTPPIPRGPGGGEAGAPVSPEPGVRPVGAVPGGAAGEAGGVGAGAPALEGAPTVGPGAPGEPGGGAAPSASLTTQAVDALRAHRTAEVQQRIGQAFARNYARYTGKPEDAERVLREVSAIANSSPEELDKLLKAKPSGEKDIGYNLQRIPVDAMSDEQKAGLALSLAARNHEYDRATVMPFDQVNADARALLQIHTPEEFMAFKKRTGLRTPADFALIDSLAATFSRDVDTSLANVRAAEIEIAKAKGINDPEALARAEQAKDRAMDALAFNAFRRDSAIDIAVNDVTQVARILGFRRSMIHPLSPEETFKARFLGAMRASGIKPEKRDALYSLLQDTIRQGPAGNWTNFTNAFRQATEIRYFDKFLEFWKAGLLGWPTQITNIGSNALFFGLRQGENAISTLANAFLPGLTGAQQKRFVGEIGARSYGARTGFREAARQLGHDLWDMARLKPPDIQRRLSEGTFFDEPDIRQLYGAIGGKTGEFVRIPFKLLDSFDNFFKHVIRSQEYSVHANRLAHDPSFRSPGESVEHATSRILGEIRSAAEYPISNFGLYRRYSAQAVKAGHQNVFEAARAAARSDTFQTPLNEAMQRIYQATQAHPSLQLMVPFFKTPYNIISEAVKRTPLGALWAIAHYKKGAINDPAFVESMVKSAVGTMLMTAAAEAALNGTITGGGPTDPKEAEILKRTGWQPYSVKIGGNYLSYQRIAPFASIAGIGADLAEAWKRRDIDTASELLQKGVASMSNNLSNQTFIAGLENTMKILTDPEKQGLSALRQFEASLVPNIIGVVPFAHAARGIDPYYRETEAFTLSPIQAQIPFASELLPPQLTPTGEERPRKGSPLERMFSPFARSEEEYGPISDAAGEIARLGIGLTAPQPFFRVGQERIYYTPEERQAIAQAQEKAMEKIGREISRPDYQRLPDEKTVEGGNRLTKRDFILRIIEQIRGPVQLRMNRQASRRFRDERA